jgi:hypothetical protein
MQAWQTSTIANFIHECGHTKECHDGASPKEKNCDGEFLLECELQGGSLPDDCDVEDCAEDLDCDELLKA